MATLYVRNFPDELYETVQELAGEDRRSISAEVVDLMSEAVRRQQHQRRRLAAMDRIEGRYERFRPAEDGVDTLTLLREDRGR
ncbi:MAG TPA: hypothetical protein VGM23_17425 [Armatimonadota bacterium]|jgi:plasmid stability protein